MEVDGKKITVRFLLNKELKKRAVNFGQGGLYPLYARVTYNRKSTKFPLGNNLLHESLDDSLDDHPALSIYRTIISKVVAFEVSKAEDKYSLNGLGNRLQTYSSNLPIAVSSLVVKHIEIQLESLLTVKEMREWKTMDSPGKISYGLQVMDVKGKPTENFIQHIMLYDLSRNIDQNLNIYGWLIDAQRGEQIDSLRDKILNNSDSFKYLTPSNFYSPDSFNLLVGLMDEACFQIIEMGYSEFGTLNKIEWDPKTGKLSVEMRTKDVE